MVPISICWDLQIASNSAQHFCVISIRSGKYENVGIFRPEMTSSSESSGSGQDTGSETEMSKSLEDEDVDSESSLEEKPKMKPYLWPAESSYGYTSGFMIFSWHVQTISQMVEKYYLPLFAC